MPLSGPSAAALHRGVHLFLGAFFLRDRRSGRRRCRSCTGTRSAMPVSLPLSSGITSPTAFAAPVVVGMMFIAAARARYGSWCGRSCTFWSFV